MITRAKCNGCGERRNKSCAVCRAILLSTPVGEVRGAPSDVIYAGEYDERLRRLILGLKYRNERHTAAMLAEALVRRFNDDVRGADVVTWAPTTSRRRRVRGHDQAELIARAVARQISRPCRSLLIRESESPQTGSGREQRLRGPLFRARRLHGGLHVVVVDDVVTTGSTLRQASMALRNAGASRVTAAAVAATPVLGRRR